METATVAVKPRRDDCLAVLVVAAREVFETMLNTKLIPVFEPAQSVRLDWTAMVGLAGMLCGVVTFSCDEQSAIQIASKMLGTHLDEADERAGDAVGEICNMIAGSFKHKINGLSDHCWLSPPTVVTGTDYRVHRQADSSMEFCRVTFVFEGTPIFVSLEIRK